MSYDMRFRGRLVYEHPDAAVQAARAFAHDECIEESVVRPEDLLIEGSEIRVDVDASAPATFRESTCWTLSNLSGEARDGSIDATYDGGEGPDSVYRIRILAGGEEEELSAEG